MADVIREIPANPEQKGLATYIPHVVYSKVDGYELALEILQPYGGRDFARPGQPLPPPKKRFPVVIFLQGSGWASPNYCTHFAQLAQFAQAGFVTVSIAEHRNIFKGVPAPAFLVDSKTAIRFLRAHADDYCIDPDRICFFGSSSGGNTAQLVGVTGDDPRYKTEEYAEYSDSVQAVVSCFGPSDMELMFADQGNPMDEMRHHMRDGFIGKDGDPQILAEMSPIRILEKGKKYPPMLLMHGTADRVVLPFQSDNMYKAYIEAGGEAELIHVPDAPHDGSFWGPASFAEILAFATRQLNP